MSGKRHWKKNALSRGQNDTTMIILGEPDSGKKDLLKAMKEDEEQKRSKGLFDYYFLGIQDEDDDDAVTNVHVWSVNNDTHAPLLERCINKETKQSLVYTIVLNMSKPETVKEN